ncbi:MAG: hypothetical protein ACOY4F_10410 [Thermodesulfobacteriota bacterium]|nr:response regulator [Desulfovibrio sp.]
MSKPTILILDSEEMVRALLADFFADNGHEVHAVASVGDALVELARRPFDVAVLDHGHGDTEGDVFLSMAREMRPELHYILHTVSMEDIPSGGFARVLGVLPRPVQDLNLFLDLLRKLPAVRESRA